MKIVSISGSSGFVGSNLVKMFESMEYKVIQISRSTLQNKIDILNIISQSDIVINLAGANILARWSEKYKKLLYSSRIETTKILMEAIKKSEKKPELFISTSAVGIYDNKNLHDENSKNYASDFLATICKDWENEALKAKEMHIRTVIFRFGVVLGDGGALSKMILPFSLGLGGKIGNGMQLFSFIHIEDLKNAYFHIINNKKLDGIFNLVAPQIITNKEFTKAFGEILHRPTFLRVPKFAIKILFGDGATVLTNGQKVVPKRLLDSGFKFKFKTIKETLDNLVGKPR